MRYLIWVYGSIIVVSSSALSAIQSEALGKPCCRAEFDTSSPAHHASSDDVHPASPMNEEMEEKESLLGQYKWLSQGPCTYTYIYIYINAYIHTHVYIYIYIYMREVISAYVCMYICMLSI